MTSSDADPPANETPEPHDGKKIRPGRQGVTRHKREPAAGHGVRGPSRHREGRRSPRHGASGSALAWIARNRELNDDGRNPADT